MKNNRSPSDDMYPVGAQVRINGFLGRVVYSDPDRHYMSICIKEFADRSKNVCLIHTPGLNNIIEPA